MKKIKTKNSEEKFSVFFRHIFFCCMPKIEDLKVNLSEKEINNITYNTDEIVDGVPSVFPSICIRDDERKIFKFTQKFIINYLTELSQKNFINKYDEPTLKLSILNHNELSYNIPVIQCKKIIKKSSFKNIPTLEELTDVILNPELRLKLDKNFKEFKIIKKLNGNIQITKMVYTPRLRKISEREFYDKKTFFVDNGVFYYFCSSIPDYIYPPKKEPVRVLNYLSAMIIKEDTKNFYVDSFSQVDIKMSIPEVFIIMSYPIKMKEFFDGLMDLFK